MQNRALIQYTLLFFVTLVFSMAAFAQTGIKSLDQTFNWDKATKTENIYIDVKKGTEKLEIDFNGKISEGDFQLAVFDPEGNKVAWFSLVSSGAGGSNVHVETSGSGSNVTVVTSGTDTESASASGSGHSATVTAASGKNKEKSKVKTKRKSKHVDGKEYSVTTTKSGSNGAKGVMVKRVPDPTPGLWKFVLEAHKVSGSMDARIEQE